MMQFSLSCAKGSFGEPPGNVCCWPEAAIFDHPLPIPFGHSARFWFYPGSLHFP